MDDDDVILDPAEVLGEPPPPAPPPELRFREIPVHQVGGPIPNWISMVLATTLGLTMVLAVTSIMQMRQIMRLERRVVKLLGELGTLQEVDQTQQKELQNLRGEIASLRNPPAPPGVDDFPFIPHAEEMRNEDEQAESEGEQLGDAGGAASGDIPMPMGFLGF